MQDVWAKIVGEEGRGEGFMVFGERAGVGGDGEDTEGDNQEEEIED